MKKNSYLCSMPGCTNPIKYKIRKLCASCYSFKYYWGKKTTQHIIKRKNNLERWLKRMDTLDTGKVTTLKKRKRA